MAPTRTRFAADALGPPGRTMDGPAAALGEVADQPKAEERGRARRGFHPVPDDRSAVRLLDGLELVDG